MAGKRDRTRAALLEVALELFATQGYEQTTMTDVAEAAGVVRQTVLNHFPRKDAFVAAWGERRRAELDAAGPPTTDTATATIERLYDHLATTNERERALTAALHAAYDAITPQRPVPAALVAAIRRGQATGELDDTTPAAVIGEVLTAVYFDTLSRWLALPPNRRLAPLLRARTRLVLAGLTR